MVLLVSARLRHTSVVSCQRVLGGSDDLGWTLSHVAESAGHRQV